MNAFLPTTALVTLLVAGLWLESFTRGFLVGRTNKRWALPVAWLALPVSVAATHIFLVDEPAGLRMLALSIVGLLGMKAVVVAQARRGGMGAFSFRGWSAFAVAWFGMRPAIFVAPVQPLESDGLVARGIKRALVGLALLLFAHLTWAATGELWLVAPPLLVGASLCLHFGLCNVMAGFWRLRGVRAQALFRAPHRSQSLGEFWGRRWNLAFSEMGSETVYRPLAARYGRSAGLTATFLFSALLHEMSISLPVGAGFGGPTVYFVLHGGLVGLERELARRGVVFRGLRGRLWTAFWVVAPLPLLFHPPFLRGVLLPLVGG